MLLTADRVDTGKCISYVCMLFHYWKHTGHIVTTALVLRVGSHLILVVYIMHITSHVGWQFIIYIRLM